ncbi:MAG: hypothetical protein ACYTHM_17490 [Planctomycetota bacterium]|jgi:hypothetical protein
MMRWIPLFLILVAVGTATAVEEEPPPPKDGKALLEKIDRLISRLGSDLWKEREDATKALVEIGEAAIPALEKALNHEDPEVRLRAGLILEEVRPVPSPHFFGERTGLRENLRHRGGGRHTESSVLMGLIWLKNHQNADGTWSCKHFPAQCKGGKCTGMGNSIDYDTGVTGLSLLAFLGNGHSHRYGKFKDVMKAGLKALKNCQTPDGCFGPKTGDGHWIYNHAICTLAMVEAYALGKKSALLKTPGQKAVDFLVDCQNPFMGWRYGRRPGENDTSVTGWAVAALKAAQAAGFQVPVESFKGAQNWFRRVTDETTHRTGYTSKGDSPPRLVDNARPFQPNDTSTAIAVVSRIFMHERKAPQKSKIFEPGNLLLKNLPKWDVKKGTIDMVYWYWGTLAMYQLGGRFWKSWNECMKNMLVPTQKREGCENGSWDPVGAWGIAGGRVYATAINVLTLEVYYRYGRLLGD